MQFINYNSIIEESLNEVYVFDADTFKFIDVNRCAREKLQYTLDELQHMTPLDIKPEYTSLSFKNLVAPLKTGEKKKIAFETVHQRKNGTTYPVEVHLQHEVFDDHRVLVAIILDKTEQKRIENQNIGLSRIFNDSLNEIYIFDAVTLQFIQVNQGACQNLGYALDELQQMTPLDIKPKMSLESFSSLIMPLRLGHKEKIEFITIHRRKDQTEYPVEVHLQLSSFGNQAVFVAIILDITERLMSQKVQFDNAVKSERIQILEQFVSDTSHEFRTPMSIINTKLFLLKNKLTDPSLLIHLQVMGEQIWRLETLVAGLHRLTQLDMIDVVDVDKVDIERLLEDVSRHLTQQYPEDSYTATIQCVDDMNAVEGSEEMLWQVFYQIIKNAYQFTDSTSNVAIRVDKRNGNCCIEICDNGIGIADDEQQKIFQRLYRIDHSRNSSTGGAGLGLAIVQRIVELHRGSVYVKSELGEGSRFYVELPFRYDIDGTLPSLVKLSS